MCRCWAGLLAVLFLACAAPPAVDSATLFQAASISKPVAATAMLRMVEDGLLGLDTPVETYLSSWTLPPGRQSPERPVTLRLIASHGAGFTVHGFPGYNAATAHDGAGRAISGRWHTYPEQAAAGLWTTPTDLMRWALEIASAREGRSAFLSPELARAMLTPQMESHGIGPGLGGEGSAFFFGHGGSNQGFKARVIYYPEAGQGAAVMTNGDRGAGLANEILDALAEVYGWPETG